MKKDLLLDYAKEYSKLNSEETLSNFLKGDIALEITKAHKEEETAKGESKIIDEFLLAAAESRSSFNQVRWVSQSFPNDVDRSLPKISWTHYRAASASSEPLKWLKAAFDDCWTVARLIQEIKSAKDEKTIDNGIKCGACNKLIEDKVTLVSISYKKRRTLLCSLKCGIEYLNLEKVHEGIVNNNVTFEKVLDNTNMLSVF